MKEAFLTWNPQEEASARVDQCEAQRVSLLSGRKVLL
jgi:hypothetical protein